VLAATVIALLLRLPGIGYHSFWYDEAESIRLAAHPAMDLATGRIHDNGSPPLFFILLKPWLALFGTTEVAARAFAVVMGVAAVPLLALVGRRLAGETAGALAAMLLAFSPFAVELSNEARTYTLTMALGLADMLFFLRWRAARRTADLLAWALLTFLACWSHVFGFVVPLAQSAVVALFGRRERLFKGWLAAMSLAGILWSTWLPTFLVQTSVHEPNRGDWIMQFLGTPVALTVGRSFAWNESSRLLLGLAMALAVGLFAPIALRGLWALRTFPFETTLLCAWLLVPSVPLFVVALFSASHYMARYSSVGLPALLVMLAAGLLSLGEKPRRAALVAVVAVCSISIVRFATVPLKDEWRGPSRVIIEEARSGEVLLFDSDHEVEAFRYYAVQKGASPPRMVGVKGRPTGDGQLPGRPTALDGRPAEPFTRDWGPDVLASEGVWVVLCRPVTPADEWESWLSARGFRRSAVHHFHHVDVLRFERSPSSARSAS
jgi:4-amino-4-deoxy-L-arabinose transferase-like glycosyltransferase